MSPLLDYTTEVPAAKTAAEIQEILRKHGATAVITEFKDAKITGLSFEVQLQGKVLPFRLPVKSDPIAKYLMNQYKRTSWGDEQRRREQRARDQAERTAWRIVKDWIQAQMALVDVEMAELQQVFLPYLIGNGNKTLYEIMQESQFLLTNGDGKQ